MLVRLLAGLLEQANSVSYLGMLGRVRQVADRQQGLNLALQPVGLTYSL
jgi:hypothetical protein